MARGSFPQVYRNKSNILTPGFKVDQLMNFPTGWFELLENRECSTVFTIFLMGLSCDPHIMLNMTPRANILMYTQIMFDCAIYSPDMKVTTLVILNDFTLLLFCGNILFHYWMFKRSKIHRIIKFSSLYSSTGRTVGKFMKYKYKGLQVEPIKSVLLYLVSNH